MGKSEATLDDEEQSEVLYIEKRGGNVLNDPSKEGVKVDHSERQGHGHEESPCGGSAGGGGRVSGGGMGDGAR